MWKGRTSLKLGMENLDIDIPERRTGGRNVQTLIRITSLLCFVFLFVHNIFLAFLYSCKISLQHVKRYFYFKRISPFRSA